MRKPFLPQIKIVEKVHHFHSHLSSPLFDICFAAQFVAVSFSKEFFRDTSSKTEERYKLFNIILFAKTNRTLYPFLKTQNTNNQNNNHTLDIVNINTTDV